jgi:aspartyl protease family protein
VKGVYCRKNILALYCALLLVCLPALASEVEILGLFTDAALIRVDGQQKLVRAGERFSGVALLEANSEAAIVEFDGQRRTLSVSQRINSSYQKVPAPAVTIRRNSNLQYITTAAVNGRRMQVLVDTGANVIAMNDATANRLGIDFRKGSRSLLTTASGEVPAWRVQLESVDVGGIRVNYLEATVLEGPQPEMMLLGTSYLQHVHLQERDGILMLMRKF